ncbi:hypothetical protein [Pelagibacterium halotolerans]|uniref:Peptidase M50 n=1 Tax=Pelagibacterium halotolerans (strain DSM 22347 / JCM 15775 / CGMCC 1.7692 / B2) TaxID=1082931 RepID=G4RGP1_PELHB|nr:hypothetical protein [Pelagibacterium halotolerans]AEQ52080.1 hypothetical protein KKY_2070 [Pelagibacterium halotolerans B2]QJR18146.1 hypothetical protein HKM20_06675 [Pelagibacterium halotolerans]SDZ83033.1 hypothetical protein SAMN05428936_101141 [Pelagibacterium halotolerans]
MFDLSFLQLLTRAIATIVVLTLMGFSVAGFARLLGDRGPAYDGKLTLNPFVHVDIFGLLSGMVARTGWIRPVAVDPAGGRLGRATPVVVALLTMAAIFLFGRLVLLALPWVATSWPTSSAAFTDATIRMMADVAGWTLALNIIPIPPFLGGYLLLALAPGAYQWLVRRHLYVSIVLTVLAVLTYRSLPATFFGDLARLLGAR